MHNLIPNDRGGLTYAATQMIGQPDQRCEALSDLRQVVDMLDELVIAVRAAWPERYSVPPEVDMLLNYHATAKARLRSGAIKRFADACHD